MSTPEAYKLKVTYTFAEEYVPFMIVVARKDKEQFCICSKCRVPYITSYLYKNTKLCTWCSGHAKSKDELAREKHNEYMSDRARWRRTLVICDKMYDAWRGNEKVTISINSS